MKFTVTVDLSLLKATLLGSTPTAFVTEEYQLAVQNTVLKNLMVAQLVKNFSRFYCTRKCIIVLT